MTKLTNILVPSNILTASNACTVTNKTISGANNTLTVRMANDVCGTLPVANGGSGQTSYTDGQILIGNTTGNTLNKNVLTGGTDITITNGAGSITIDYVPPDVNLIYSWGYNTCASLGDNTTTNKSSPVSVVGGFTNWCQVSSQLHSLAVRTNGTAWAWGRANYGILGDNSTVNKSSPVLILGGFTDWCQLSGGTNHSLGVRTNGTAWGWGVKDSGEIGDNQTAVNRSSPVSVVGGFTDWCQVAAGINHSLGVRTNGTAWGWGQGGNGRLGNNSTADTSSPVSVVGGFTDWCQVSGGYKFSLAVRQNGTAWGWGYNVCGRLGNNTTVSTSSPVSVVGGFTDWCQVETGGGHSLGVRQNGTAWAWGRSCYGSLGDNTDVAKSSPVSVVGGFTDWCQVSAGYRHSVGVRTNGTAWAWGQGNNGQLGNNATDNKSSPVSVVGGFTNWCQISAATRGSGNVTLAISSEVYA
jgi:alpha-tubulin suppressor-like RCC1 family protein